MSDANQDPAALIQELLRMVDEFLRHMAALEAENLDLRAQLLSSGQEPGQVMAEPALALALVVDPEAGRASDLIAMLGRCGCKGEVVASGEAALRRLGAERYSLVLVESDLGGEDGLELVRRIAEIAPGTDLLIVVGFTGADIAVQALRLGASAFCLRPVQEAELGVRVRELLQRQLIEQRSRRYLNDLRTRYSQIMAAYKSAG